MKRQEAKVISNKKFEEGTLKVQVQRIKKITKYNARVKVKKSYIVHHPSKDYVEIGDIVHIRDCAPVSKTKRKVIVL